MAIGDALGKNITYGEVEDIVRLRTDTLADTTISSSLMLKLISISIQKWAKILNGATAPYYSKTSAISGANLTGTANPYTVNLSAENPFIDTIKKVVHITSGGTRTLVKKLPFEDGEVIQGFNNFYAASLFYVHEGDALRLFTGTSFTITIASDIVNVTFYRQPIVSGVSRTSKIDIPDSFSSTVITDVVSQVLAFKNGGISTPALESELSQARQSIMSAYAEGKQVEQLEKKN